MVIVRKHGSVYEYRFEAASVDGTREWITKSGFRTKTEALESGSQAYTEYLNAGIPVIIFGTISPTSFQMLDLILLILSSFMLWLFAETKKLLLDVKE